MELLNSLFFGSGIAHQILVLALVITFGILLGKIKIAGISLGVTWILFVGIAASHFGMRLDAEVLHFIKEFGLILFVFSIGLQVGPSFFATFKSGGIKLVGLATIIVLLGVATTYVIHLVTGTPIPTMVGILSGAVTNTPGLGAAQQAYTEAAGVVDPTIAQGYAVAYPLGVVGIILSMIFIRSILKIKFDKENQAVTDLNKENDSLHTISLEFTNEVLNGSTIAHIASLVKRRFVISRIKDNNGVISIAEGSTALQLGYKLMVVCSKDDEDAIEAFYGHKVEMERSEWDITDDKHTRLVSKSVVVTREKVNGVKLSELKLRARYSINITRVHRAGLDILPYPNMALQIGDVVKVVGKQGAVDNIADLLGNSKKHLNEPQLITLFVGIALGVLLGSIPFLHVPQAVKLGLAGGPLIVAILIGRFGTKFHLNTYTTLSVNLMLREVGISLFLAAVGLGAGDGFIDTIMNGGLSWVGYGAMITIIPILIVGLYARLKMKMNYFTLMGLISGSLTDPPALAYSNTTAGNDMPSIAYATVYPFVMFLRVFTAQLFILLAI